MRIKKILLLLTLSLIVLAGIGCGSKADPTAAVTLKWDGVNYYFGESVLPIDNFTGDSAIVTTVTATYNIMLDSAKDVTNITVNAQGILEENMDTYKDLFYYQEYLGSKTTGALCIGPDLWAVAQTGSGTPAILAKEMYDILSTLPLTQNSLYVDVGDAFTFGSEYERITCRMDKILVPNVIQVLPGQVNPNMEPYTFTKEDGTTVSGMYGATDSYDYYFYGGYTIQIYKGGNIYEYIKFK